MLGLAWLGTYLSFKHRPGVQSSSALADFPELSAAVRRDPHGWFTAEVGRQPWVVFGVLRTADAMTPF